MQMLSVEHEPLTDLRRGTAHLCPATPGQPTYRRAIGTIFGLPFFATRPLPDVLHLQTPVCKERHVGEGATSVMRVSRKPYLLHVGTRETWPKRSGEARFSCETGPTNPGQGCILLVGTSPETEYKRACYLCDHRDSKRACSLCDHTDKKLASLSAITKTTSVLALSAIPETGSVLAACEITEDDNKHACHLCDHRDGKRTCSLSR